MNFEKYSFGLIFLFFPITFGLVFTFFQWLLNRKKNKSIPPARKIPTKIF